LNYLSQEIGNEYAVLFDLDGVIVSSENIRKSAHIETVAQLGGLFEHVVFSDLAGYSLEKTIFEIINATNIKCSVKDYLPIFEIELSKQLKNDIPIIEGIPKLFQELFEEGISILVVTSSRRWVCDQILRKSGLAKFVLHSITANDVVDVKPNPAPYLLAASLLPKVSYLVAIEDSKPGAISAQKARLPVLGFIGNNGHSDIEVYCNNVLLNFKNTPKTIEVIKYTALGQKRFDFSSNIQNDFNIPLLKLLVTDIRGTLLKSEKDSLISMKIVKALAEILSAGINLAFITGSSIKTTLELVINPLINLLIERNEKLINSPLYFYTGHGAAGWKIDVFGNLNKLEGYQEMLMSNKLKSTIYNLLNQSPAYWKFQSYFIREGQINIAIDGSLNYRIKIAEEIKKCLMLEGIKEKYFIHVPSAKKRIDISVSSKERAMKNLLVKTKLHTNQVILIADSMHMGGPDNKMFFHQEGMIGIQVGRKLVPENIFHGPGIGQLGTLSWLLSIANIKKKYNG